MNNIAIEELKKKRHELILARDSAFALATKDIEGIEAALEALTGGKIWEEIEKEEKYDDESPDYIKQSIEEI